MSQSWPLQLYDPGAVFVPAGGGHRALRGPHVRLRAGRRDLTRGLRTATWSSVDPGGLETLSAGVDGGAEIQAGDPAELWVGLARGWQGTVNDPGDEVSGRGRQLVCVGPGHALKSHSIPAMYTHARLSDWQNIHGHSTSDLSELAAGASVISDGAAVTLAFPQGIAIPFNRSVAVGIDLGPGRACERIVATYEAQNVTADQSIDARGSQTGFDMSASQQASGFGTALSTGGASSGTRSGTFADPARFVWVLLYQGNAGTLTPAADETVKLTSIQMFASAEHESAGASVLRPDQVVLDVLRQLGTGEIAAGQIAASGMQVPHLAPEGLVTLESLTGDMAKLTGWHWGTWEPATALDARARMFFCPPPARASAAVRWADCEQGEAPRVRHDLLYDACRCAYVTVDGQTGYATAARPNPHLRSGSRTLEVNMGQGTAQSAALYAGYALALAQRAARGGGWAVLPERVQTPSGPMLSCLLRAGRDRLRIAGLPDSGSLLDEDRSTDTFHLRRVESTLDEGGRISTRAEFDGGGDLLEVLGAQLANAMNRPTPVAA